MQGGSTSGIQIEMVSEPLPSTPSHALFQNLTLFLAAFNGAPQNQDSSKTRYGSEISNSLRKWEASLDAASVLLFFETITDLTVAESPLVRYTSVQVGTEVALPYLRLLVLQLSKWVPAPSCRRKLGLTPSSRSLHIVSCSTV